VVVLEFDVLDDGLVGVDWVGVDLILVYLYPRMGLNLDRENDGLAKWKEEWLIVFDRVVV
jgi:hypothetical protein